MTETSIPLSLIFSSESTDSVIQHLDDLLYKKYEEVLEIDHSLSRQLVSFQANKKKSAFRWYKFKEAFSSDLVESVISKYIFSKGVILDPFAGSGTTLFTAFTSGYSCDGIELLPIAQEIISTRLIIDNLLSKEEIQTLLDWTINKPWEIYESNFSLPTIRISENAYPEGTQNYIENFIELSKKESTNVNKVLLFALLCILEDVSYTRKDGQYLRWDFRAKRFNSGKKVFTKKKILSFSEAICTKLQEITSDILNTESFNNNYQSKTLIRLFKGSNLEKLPEFNDNSYVGIITSPPYCNRYDYTRTYALELALLGLNDIEVINLRQQMLSSTVENRAKKLLDINPAWKKPLEIVGKQELLQGILNYYDLLKQEKELNNTGIPRMVRGYFNEMACIIYECYRVLEIGAPLIMVNDNVRYAGISIPVDLILSDIANNIGFSIEKILVLANGKGNSSQQMGKHGRDQLRKCVYIWRKK